MDGSNVAGATTSTYTPDVADLGKPITVKVTSTRNGYTTVTKESVATAPVGLGDLSPDADPVVQWSSPKVGVTFTADPGTWDSASRSPTSGPPTARTSRAPRPSPTGDRRRPRQGDRRQGDRQQDRLQQRHQDLAAELGHRAGDQVLTPVPTITGTPQVGQSLTAVPGTWDDGVDLTYQWTADGTDVPSATTAAYTPVAGDVGR